MRATHVSHIFYKHLLLGLNVLAPILLTQSVHTAGVAFLVPHCRSEEEPPHCSSAPSNAEFFNWQKDRTYKHECCIFLGSIFLPLEMGCLLNLKRFAEAADYFALEKHSLTIFCPG